MAAVVDVFPQSIVFTPTRSSVAVTLRHTDRRAGVVQFSAVPSGWDLIVSPQEGSIAPGSTVSVTVTADNLSILTKPTALGSVQFGWSGQQSASTVVCSFGADSAARQPYGGRLSAVEQEMLKSVLAATAAPAPAAALAPAPTRASGPVQAFGDLHDTDEEVSTPIQAEPPPEIMELLIKNCSKKPQDRLMPDQLNVLRSVRDATPPPLWQMWQSQARAELDARRKREAAAAAAPAPTASAPTGRTPLKPAMDTIRPMSATAAAPPRTQAAEFPPSGVLEVDSVIAGLKQVPVVRASLAPSPTVRHSHPGHPRPMSPSAAPTGPVQQAGWLTIFEAPASGWLERFCVATDQNFSWFAHDSHAGSDPDAGKALGRMPVAASQAMMGTTVDLDNNPPPTGFMFTVTTQDRTIVVCGPSWGVVSSWFAIFKSSNTRPPKSAVVPAQPQHMIDPSSDYVPNFAPTGRTESAPPSRPPVLPHGGRRLPSAVARALTRGDDGASVSSSTSSVPWPQQSGISSVPPSSPQAEWPGSHPSPAWSASPPVPTRRAPRETPASPQSPQVLSAFPRHMGRTDSFRSGDESIGSRNGHRRSRSFERLARPTASSTARNQAQARHLELRKRSKSSNRESSSRSDWMSEGPRSRSVSPGSRGERSGDEWDGDEGYDDDDMPMAHRMPAKATPSAVARTGRARARRPPAQPPAEPTGRPKQQSQPKRRGSAPPRPAPRTPRREQQPSGGHDRPLYTMGSAASTPTTQDRRVPDARVLPVQAELHSLMSVDGFDHEEELASITADRRSALVEQLVHVESRLTEHEQARASLERRMSSLEYQGGPDFAGVTPASRTNTRSPASEYATEARSAGAAALKATEQLQRGMSKQRSPPIAHANREHMSSPGHGSSISDAASMTTDRRSTRSPLQSRLNALLPGSSSSGHAAPTDNSASLASLASRVDALTAQLAAEASHKQRLIAELTKEKAAHARTRAELEAAQLALQSIGVASDNKQGKRIAAMAVQRSCRSMKRSVMDLRQCVDSWTKDLDTSYAAAHEALHLLVQQTAQAFQTPVPVAVAPVSVRAQSAAPQVVSTPAPALPPPAAMPAPPRLPVHAIIVPTSEPASRSSILVQPINRVTVQVRDANNRSQHFQFAAAWNVGRERWPADLVESVAALGESKFAVLFVGGPNSKARLDAVFGEGSTASPIISTVAAPLLTAAKGSAGSLQVNLSCVQIAGVHIQDLLSPNGSNGAALKIIRTASGGAFVGDAVAVRLNTLRDIASVCGVIVPRTAAHALLASAAVGVHAHVLLTFELRSAEALVHQTTIVLVGDADSTTVARMIAEPTTGSTSGPLQVLCQDAFGHDGSMQCLVFVPEATVQTSSTVQALDMWSSLAAL